MIPKWLRSRTPSEYSVLHEHKWMALCTGYQGEPFIHASPGVTIVPVNDAGEVLFIMEPARTNGQPVLTLPSGALDLPEAPAAAANRELQEETGYRAGRLDFLGKVSPAARHMAWYIHLFLARDLTPSPMQGDEDYPIEIRRVPFNEFETLIASGELYDAVVIAALFLAKRVIEV